MHDSGTTWNVKPPDEPWMSLIRARAASLGLVAALGFVTIVSLLASAALSALGQELATRTPAGNNGPAFASSHACSCVGSTTSIRLSVATVPRVSR